MELFYTTTLVLGVWQKINLSYLRLKKTYITYYKIWVRYILNWISLNLYVSIDPYTPYEVNISAVTIAGTGKALHKVFFTQETGINF